MSNHLRRAAPTLALAAIVLAPACDESNAHVEGIVLVAGQPVDGYKRIPAEDAAGFGFPGEDIVTPGPPIRVKAGEPVTVTMRNEHYRPHGLTGEVQPFDEPHNLAMLAGHSEFIPDPLWGSLTRDIMTGESVTITFTPDVPGTCYYVCTLGGHRTQRGMFGELIVEP